MSSLAKIDLVFQVFRLVQVSEVAFFGWQNWNPSFGDTEILCLPRMVIRLNYISAISAY